MHGAAAALLADRDAHRPGRRRRAALGELVGDPHRRLPRRTSAGWRSASTRSPRSPARSSASCSAASSRRSRGGSSSSSRCPSASSAPSGRTASCASSASGGRPASTGGATSRSPSASIARARRDHLRDPAVRRPHDGLDEPDRALPSSSAGSPCWPSSCVIELRVDEPMFRLDALPHPGLHGGQHRQPAGLARPRRAAVHADHLAAGHLAAAARLRLRRDAALGGHLHAAADRRLPVAGPASGWLSDRFGARPFATGGMLLAALTLLPARSLLPVDFDYGWFARAPAAERHRRWACSRRPTSAGIMNSAAAARSAASAPACSRRSRTRRWCSRSASSSR